MSKVEWDKPPYDAPRLFDGEDVPSKKGTYEVGEFISLSYKGTMIRLQITSIPDRSVVVAEIADLQSPQAPDKTAVPDEYRGRSDLPTELSYNKKYVVDPAFIYHRMKSP